MRLRTRSIAPPDYRDVLRKARALPRVSNPRRRRRIWPTVWRPKPQNRGCQSEQPDPNADSPRPATQGAWRLWGARSSGRQPALCLPRLRGIGRWRHWGRARSRPDGGGWIPCISRTFIDCAKIKPLQLRCRGKCRVHVSDAPIDQLDYRMFDSSRIASCTLI